ELVHFLRCHSETLEALYLNYYIMGSSRILLDDLKEQLHLKKFGLGDRWGHLETLETEGRIYAYKFYSRDKIDRM
ncbi:hypothetical protein RUND412_007162, partial [Rhizina undulata]